MSDTSDRLRHMLEDLLGSKKPEDHEVLLQMERRAFREALEDPTHRMNMQFVSLIITRVDGEEVLVVSGVVRTDKGHTLDSVLGDIQRFVDDIVMPALQPDQRVTVRTHDFDAGFLTKNFRKAFDPRDLAVYMATIRAEADREEVLKKYRKCCACDDQDCKRRITEPPANVAPEPSPTPESEF